MVQRYFFDASPIEAFGDPESIGCDADGGVMVNPLPSSSLIVRQSEFLLQFLIVALNSPAHLGHEDDLFQRGVNG